MSRMTTLKITVAIPDRALHPNGRAYWAKKARATRFARYRAADAATMAMLDGGYVFHEKPKWARASVQATFYSRTRKGLEADEDGLVASLKPTMDGIADAGVVENDRGFTWMSPPVLREVDKLNPRVEICIIKLEERA